MTPEGRVKRRWAVLAKRFGIVYINLVMTGDKGDPDKIILPRGGCPIFAEFKAPEGKLSASQKRKIDLYRGLHYDVRVIRGVAEAEALAEEIRQTNEVHSSQISD